MNSNNINTNNNTMIAEYIWSDLNGNLRSKIKIIQKVKHNDIYSLLH